MQLSVYFCKKSGPDLPLKMASSWWVNRLFSNSHILRTERVNENLFWFFMNPQSFLGKKCCLQIFGISTPSARKTALNQPTVSVLPVTTCHVHLTACLLSIKIGRLACHQDPSFVNNSCPTTTGGLTIHHLPSIYLYPSIHIHRSIHRSTLRNFGEIGPKKQTLSLSAWFKGFSLGPAVLFSSLFWLNKKILKTIGENTWRKQIIFVIPSISPFISWVDRSIMWESN